MNNNEFKLFSELIHKHSGIDFNPEKKSIYTAKIQKRMEELDISDFLEYLHILEKDLKKDEITLLINHVSTNKTHFFREKMHFDFIRNQIPLLPKQKEILIWSAGCSTGEEPYSLAIQLIEELPLFSNKIRILATDISTKVLNVAQQGIFTDSQVSDIPRAWLLKYFLKTKEGYKIKDMVKKLIHFRYLNLSDPFPLTKLYHFILCRNVMIYFNNQTIKDLSVKFHNQLEKKGYLLVGHSESLKFSNTELAYIEPSIYQENKSH